MLYTLENGKKMIGSHLWAEKSRTRTHVLIVSQSSWDARPFGQQRLISLTDWETPIGNPPPNPASAMTSVINPWGTGKRPRK